MTASANTSTTPPLPPPPPLSNDTLRERILTGGGTGNARGSLTRVASRYATFLRSLSSSDATTAADDAAAALQTELLLHDLEIRKLILSSRASDDNSSRFSPALSAMRDSLASTRRDIGSLTAALADERRIRRNREEYDALAKMANDKSPPIRETTSELQRVQREIDEVKGEVREAKWELTVREKQMRLFMQSLGDLKATLREEDLKKEIARGGVGEKGKGGKGNGISSTLASLA